MAETELPEGTDSIVAGAAVTDSEKDLIVSEPTGRNKVVAAAKELTTR